jgi:SAM-dependent methyltransferase
VTPPVEPASLHEAEARFHDRWAAGTDASGVGVREAFEALTAPENRFILSRMGDLRGKRLLDVGAGLGESSVYFALRGADVTAADVSPGMIEHARTLAERHGVSVRGLVCPAESLPVDPWTFDLVYAANTIHHVHDRGAMYDAVLRALRPGGWFFAWDPLAYNPAINVYRRMATAVRTPDERPLTFADFRAFSARFEHAGHREFWIAGLALFAKYYLVDRVHPNDERYWKRVLRETPGSLWWWRPLAAADALLTRLPLVKRLSWNMVMWGRRPASRTDARP